MKTYEVDGRKVCVGDAPIFDSDDHAFGCPIYVSTGYVLGEPEHPHTWRLFWLGSALNSRVPPAVDAQPYKAVEISSKRVFVL